MMYSDSTGNSPEWWHWVASGAMVVGGVALMFTPLGILGGALVTAGVSSMVGGYLSEQSGGSFTAGWVGGAVAGFVSGLGAGMASSLYYAATISAGGGTFYAMGSFAVAGTLGFLGNFGGSIITQSWDNKQIDFTQAFVSGTIGGILNVAFVPFSAGANVLSKFGYQTLSVGYSILVETISQVASYGIDQVINGSHNYRFNRLTRRFG